MRTKDFERVIYGSSRLGINTNKVDMLDEDPEDVLSLSLGNKLYEMSNHLGNVLTVINDIKVPQSSNSVDVDGYLATIVSTADYSPFGVQLDERTVSAESYRYGFNGMEKDDELKGKGNSYDFGARMHDPRLGRWLTRDPLEAKYPAFSGYCFSINSPIYIQDVDGRDIIISYVSDDNKSIELKYIPNGKVPSGIDDFAQTTWAILNLLYTSGGPKAAQIINNLSTNTYGLDVYIYETAGGSAWNTQYLEFNPTYGLIVDVPNPNTESTVLSPAVALIHELDHAHQQVFVLYGKVLSLEREKQLALFYGMDAAFISDIDKDINAAEIAFGAFVSGLADWASEENRVVNGVEAEASSYLGNGSRSCYTCFVGEYVSSNPLTTEVNVEATESQFGDSNRQRQEQMKNKSNDND